MMPMMVSFPMPGRAGGTGQALTAQQTLPGTGFDDFIPGIALPGLADPGYVG